MNQQQRDEQLNNLRSKFEAAVIELVYDYSSDNYTREDFMTEMDKLVEQFNLAYNLIWTE